MTDYYLDSSVAVRALLGHSAAAAGWFDETNDDPASSVLSSRILRTELTRVLRRERQPVARRDEILAYIGTVPLTDAILAEAEAILLHVRTLDAIHLASAVSTGLDLVVVTHDLTMSRVAEQLGYEVHDPGTD